MQSIMKSGLCASALLLFAACGEQPADSAALTVETEAAADAATVSPAPAAAPPATEEAWYAIIPFEVAPENRARVAELSGATVAPAQAAIEREMLQFFPAGDATSGFLILGRFDSEADALAHSNPGQDQEFLAAYQEHMGDAGGAATAETMSMMTPGAAMIAHRAVTTPPVADGMSPDAEPVYYVAHTLDFIDDAAAADSHAIIEQEFMGAAAAPQGEVMAFRLVGQAADWLVFAGRHGAPEPAEAAAESPARGDGETRTHDVAVVYRHLSE